MPILPRSMPGTEAVELSWFEDLVALSKVLNFSRAAETRNVTQPAFSRRIRALEDRFKRDERALLESLTLEQAMLAR